MLSRISDPGRASHHAPSRGPGGGGNGEGVSRGEGLRLTGAEALSFGAKIVAESFGPDFLTSLPEISSASCLCPGSASTGHDDGVLHTVNDLFVRRADRRKDSAELNFFAAGRRKEIGTEAHPAFHLFDLAGLAVVERMADQLPFVKFLENIRMVGKGVYGIIHRFAPVFL